MPRLDTTSNKSAKAATLRTLIMLALALVAVRLFHLQVIQADDLREASKNNRLRVEHIPAMRGLILDRNGTVLAGNRPSFWCTIDPLVPTYVEEPKELDRTLAALAVLLDEDRGWLVNKVSRERFSAPLGVRLRGDLREWEVASIEERASKMDGVWIEARPLRWYPHGKLAAHLLGIVGEVTASEIGDASAGGHKPGDFIGRGGVEGQCDKRLRGKTGRRSTEVNALGRRVDPSKRPYKEPASPGGNLILALDQELQSLVEGELEPFRAGAVVVVSIEDGGVLAMASKPAFDPNAFARGLTQTEWKALEGDKLYPLLNRCTQATYPPGSTLKVVTAVAALEEGVVSPDERPVNCPGFYVLGNRRYACWRETGHGRPDMVQAIAQSCDSYFYELGKRLGVEKLSTWMKRLGLHVLTGVDLPMEKSGFIPGPEWYDERYGRGKWTQGLALNLAIGQGELLTTPLKLATLAMAIGGSGRWTVPHVTANPPGLQVRSWNVSEATLSVVRHGMLEAVQGERGSARRAAVPGVLVGGKTGTVQNPHGEDHSVFIGFAPWPSPLVAISVFLENAGHGGQVAAPMAGRILDYYFNPPGPEASGPVPISEPVAKDPSQRLENDPSRVLGDSGSQQREENSSSKPSEDVE